MSKAFWVLNSHFQPFGPSIETELLPNVISGTGMPSFAANSSQFKEEDIGNFVQVIVHPARVMDSEEWVVVRV